MPPSGCHIPARFESLVKHLLQPGEAVVWCGQPSRILYGLFPLGALLGCLSFYGGLFVSIGAILPWQLLAILAGLTLWLLIGPLAGLLACQWSHADRTLYLLTNQRAIHCRPTWRGQYTFVETRPESLLVPFVPRYSDPFAGNAQFRWLWNGKAIHALMESTLLPQLSQRLKHLDNAVRRKAILVASDYVAHGRVRPDTLVAALDSEDSFIRMQAARALGALGSKGGTAVEMLQRAVFDDDLRVSQAAKRSIQRIRGAVPNAPNVLIGYDVSPD